MNRKRLSSFGSGFFKVIFPFMWIVLFGLGTLFMWQSNMKEKYQFLVVWLGVGTFILIVLASLKRVAIEGTDLVISNYLKTIRVPLSQIQSVSENFLFSPKIIFITFKTPTAFGKRIKFMPVISLKDIFCEFRSHSIVKELRELSEANMSHPDS